MLTTAREQMSACTIINMAALLNEQRTLLNADILIWVDDDSNSAVTDFEDPIEYDFKVTKIDDSVIEDIVRKINTIRK